MTFYSVFQNHSNNEKELVTIVQSKKQAREYICEHVIHTNYQHYKQWCELHDEQLNSDESVDNYMRKVVGYENMDIYYTTIRTKMNKKRLYGMLRVLNGCIPLACSFQTVDEDMFLEELLEQQKEQNDNSQLIN